MEEMTLELECVEDELSPAQLEHQKIQEGNYKVMQGLVERWKKSGRHVTSVEVNNSLTIYRSPNPARQQIRPSKSAQLQIANIASSITNGQILSGAVTATTNTYGAPIPASVPPLSQVQSQSSVQQIRLLSNPQVSMPSLFRPIRHSGPIRITTSTSQPALGMSQTPAGLSVGRAPLQIRLPTQVIGSVHQLVLDPTTGHLLLTQPHPHSASQVSTSTNMNNVVNAEVSLRGGNLTIVPRTQLSQTSSVSTLTHMTYARPTPPPLKRNVIVKSNPVNPYIPKPSTLTALATATPMPTPTSSASATAPVGSFFPKIMSVTSLNRNSPQPGLVPVTIPAQQQQHQHQQQLQHQQHQPPKQQPPPTRITITGGPKPVVLRNGVLVSPSTSISTNAQTTNVSMAPAQRTLQLNRPRPMTPEDPCRANYPSLVVNVRPWLKTPFEKSILSNSRAKLDETVKELINMDLAKFVEWLLRKGLLRVDLKCDIHTPEQGSVLKLGKYNNQSNEPFSGGYIWVAECCRGKQVSVFYGSIFEGSTFPPNTLLKLIYHWACQTSPRNIVDWVKISPYFLKNFYTLLRSVCIAGVHQYLYLLGGKDKSIEVGLLKIQTTRPGSSLKKVSVLAAYDPMSKDIRFRIVKLRRRVYPPGFPQSEKEMQEKFDILGPLKLMVHRDSSLLIDKTLSLSTFRKIGFRGPIRSTGDTPDVSPNGTVMEYLRRVVPKAFSTTLNVLSDALIQQFLDEMTWREKWGETPELAFNTIMDQLAQMTRVRTCPNLLNRLNEISMNPFVNCAWNPTVGQMSTEQLRAASASEQTPIVMLKPRTVNPNPTPKVEANGLNGDQSQIQNPFPIITDASIPKVYPSTHPPPLLAFDKSTVTQTHGQQVKRKADALMMPAPTPSIDFETHYASEEKLLGLQSYYYAESNSATSKILDKFPVNLKCPMCSMVFESNENILMHFMVHVKSMGMKNKNSLGFCIYCFKDVGQGTLMTSHVEEQHKLYMGCGRLACLICQEGFPTEKAFTIHMWKNHARRDMPYRCEICEYRSSYHWNVVDHFNDKHRGIAVVQCPICLKIIHCKSFNCLKLIIVHVQTHVLKKGRKCNHCILNFTSDQEFRAHITENSHSDDFVTPATVDAMPMELPDGVEETRMATPPKQKRNYDKMPILNKMPKLMARPQPHTSTTTQDSPTASVKPKLLSPPPVTPVTIAPNSGVVYKDEGSKYNRDSRNPVEVVDYNVQRTVCVECTEHAASPAHYPGGLVCNICDYFTTCCRKAMKEHQKIVHPRPGSCELLCSLKSDDMEVPLIPDIFCCSCGYFTLIGDDLAYHIEACPQNPTQTVYGSDDEEETLKDNAQNEISIS